MLESYLRPTYQKCLIDPIVKHITVKISPNTVTLTGCVVGVLVMPLLLLGYLKSACVALLLSGYLDTLDGTLARQQNASSVLGTMLDIVGDRIVEVAVVLGLFSIAPSTRGWSTLGMLGSILVCVTTFLVVGIFSENASAKGFHYSEGLMERAEAFIFFVAMILLPQYFHFLAGLFTFLVSLTALIRIYQFWKYCVRLNCISGSR